MTDSNYNDDSFRYKLNFGRDILNHSDYHEDDFDESRENDFDECADNEKEDKSNFDDDKDKKKDEKNDRNDRNEDTHCCKNSMIDALNLLRNNEFSNIFDNLRFAFISDDFIVGARLKNLCDNIDNITGPKNNGVLSARLKRFPRFDADLLEISGNIEPLYDPYTQAPITSITSIPVDSVSLCNLRVVCFELLNTSNDTNTFVGNLRDLLNKKQDFKDDCNCRFNNCSCNKGISERILRRFGDRTITLAVGPLFLNSTSNSGTVLVLGKIGNVLILAARNPSGDFTGRIYFVCLDAISFIG